MNDALLVKDLDLVKALVAKGADINEAYIGLPLLIWAMRNSTSEIVTFLIEQGANANAFDESNIPVLNVAIHSGQFDIARLLVDKGANVNTSDKQGETPLMATIKLNSQWLSTSNGTSNGNFQIKDCEDFVGFLIEHKADVNVADWFNTPTLIWAVSENAPEMLRLLIKGGADVNVTNHDGKSALLIAEEGKQSEIIKIILNAGALMKETPKLLKNGIILSVIVYCDGVMV